MKFKPFPCSERSRTIFAAVLSGILFSNTALAGLSESNFWMERSLPKHPRPAASLPIASGQKALGVPAFPEEILRTFGSVRKVVRPSGQSSDRVVLHIQDIHQNPEAQKNISNLMTALMNRQSISLVALEGGFGNLDIARVKSKGDPESWERTADFLLGQGKITGPVHALLSRREALPAVRGIDDAAAYAANVEAYRASVKGSAPLQTAARAAFDELLARGKKTFSQGIVDAQMLMAAHDKGIVTFGDYTGRLEREFQRLSLPLEYPQFHAFRAAVEMERTLDFARIEQERNRFLQDPRPSLSAYPLLERYVRYFNLSSGIDGEALFQEIRRMETLWLETLAKTPEEKRWNKELRRQVLIGKLLDFSLTSSEWQEYRRGEETSPPRAFEDFYRQAEIRDRVMADNLLQASSKNTVLVTGGFHSTAIERRLVEAGYTVVRFVPRVSKVDVAQSSKYLSVFNQEKTPLEKLGQGEKLFLSPEVWTPGLSLTARVFAALRHAFLAVSRIPEKSLLADFKDITGLTARSVRLDKGDIAVELRDAPLDLRAKFNMKGDFLEVTEQVRRPLRERVRAPLNELRRTLALVVSRRAGLDFVRGHDPLNLDPLATMKRLMALRILRMGTWLTLGIGHPLVHLIINLLFPESPLTLPKSSAHWMPLEEVAYRSAQMREDGFAPRYEEFLDDPALFEEATKEFTGARRIDTSILNQGASEYQGLFEIVANAVDATVEEQGGDPIGRFGNGFRSLLALLKRFPGPNSRVQVTTKTKTGPTRTMLFRNAIDADRNDHFEVTWRKDDKKGKAGTIVDVTLDGPATDRKLYMEKLETELQRIFSNNRMVRILFADADGERTINPLGQLKSLRTGKKTGAYFAKKQIRVETTPQGFRVLDNGGGISDKIFMEKFLVPRSPNKAAQKGVDFDIRYQPGAKPTSKSQQVPLTVTKGGRAIAVFDNMKGRNLPGAFELELPASAWVTESWDRFEIKARKSAPGDVDARDIAEKIIQSKVPLQTKARLLNAYALVLVRLSETTSEDLFEPLKEILLPWVREIRKSGAVIVPNAKPGFFTFKKQKRDWLYLDPHFLVDFIPEHIPGVERVTRMGETHPFDVAWKSEALYLADFEDKEALSFKFGNMTFFSRRHFMPHTIPAPQELWFAEDTGYGDWRKGVKKTFVPTNVEKKEEDRLQVSDERFPFWKRLAANLRERILSRLKKARALADQWLSRLGELLEILHKQPAWWAESAIAAALQGSAGKLADAGPAITFERDLDFGDIRNPLEPLKIKDRQFIFGNSIGESRFFEIKNQMRFEQISTPEDDAFSEIIAWKENLFCTFIIGHWYSSVYSFSGEEFRKIGEMREEMGGVAYDEKGIYFAGVSALPDTFYFDGRDFKRIKFLQLGEELDPKGFEKIGTTVFGLVNREGRDAFMIPFQDGRPERSKSVSLPIGGEIKTGPSSTFDGENGFVFVNQSLLRIDKLSKAEIVDIGGLANFTALKFFKGEIFAFIGKEADSLKNIMFVRGKVVKKNNAWVYEHEVVPVDGFEQFGAMYEENGQFYLHAADASGHWFRLKVNVHRKFGEEAAPTAEPRPEITFQRAVDFGVSDWSDILISKVVPFDGKRYVVVGGKLCELEEGKVSPVSAPENEEIDSDLFTFNRALYCFRNLKNRHQFLLLQYSQGQFKKVDGKTSEPGSIAVGEDGIFFENINHLYYSDGKTVERKVIPGNLGYGESQILLELNNQIYFLFKDGLEIFLVPWGVQGMKEEEEPWGLKLKSKMHEYPLVIESNSRQWLGIDTEDGTQLFELLDEGASREVENLDYQNLISFEFFGDELFVTVRESQDEMKLLRGKIVEKDGGLYYEHEAVDMGEYGMLGRLQVFDDKLHLNAADASGRWHQLEVVVPPPAEEEPEETEETRYQVTELAAIEGLDRHLEAQADERAVYFTAGNRIVRLADGKAATVFVEEGGGHSIKGTALLGGVLYFLVNRGPLSQLMRIGASGEPEVVMNLEDDDYMLRAALGEDALIVHGSMWKNTFKKIRLVKGSAPEISPVSLNPDIYNVFESRGKIYLVMIEESTGDMYLESFGSAPPMDPIILPGGLSNSIVPFHHGAHLYAGDVDNKLIYRLDERDDHHSPVTFETPIHHKNIGYYGSFSGEIWAYSNGDIFHGRVEEQAGGRLIWRNKKLELGPEFKDLGFFSITRDRLFLKAARAADSEEVLLEITPESPVATPLGDQVVTPKPLVDMGKDAPKAGSNSWAVMGGVFFFIDRDGNLIGLATPTTEKTEIDKRVLAVTEFNGALYFVKESADILAHELWRLNAKGQRELVYRRELSHDDLNVFFAVSGPYLVVSDASQEPGGHLGTVNLVPKEGPVINLPFEGSLGSPGVRQVGKDAYVGFDDWDERRMVIKKLGERNEWDESYSIDLTEKDQESQIGDIVSDGDLCIMQDRMLGRILSLDRNGHHQTVAFRERPEKSFVTSVAFHDEELWTINRVSELARESVLYRGKITGTRGGKEDLAYENVRVNLGPEYENPKNLVERDGKLYVQVQRISDGGWSHVELALATPTSQTVLEPQVVMKTSMKYPSEKGGHSAAMALLKEKAYFIVGGNVYILRNGMAKEVDFGGARLAAQKLHVHNDEVYVRLESPNEGIFVFKLTDKDSAQFVGEIPSLDSFGQDFIDFNGRLFVPVDENVYELGPNGKLVKSELSPARGFMIESVATNGNRTIVVMERDGKDYIVDLSHPKTSFQGPMDYVIHKVVLDQNRIFFFSDIDDSNRFNLKLSIDRKIHDVQTMIDIANTATMEIVNDELFILSDKRLRRGKVERNGDVYAYNSQEVQLSGYTDILFVKSENDGLHLLAIASDGDLHWLRLTKEQLAASAPTRAGPVRKSLVPGALSLGFYRDEIISFLQEFQSFLSDQARSLFRGQLLNRLFYERELGAAIDRDVLKILTLLPETLLTYLGADLIELLRGVVRHRALERLVPFFDLANPAGNRFTSAQDAIAFFTRWIRLYEALESKKDGLDSFFQLMNPSTLLYLARTEPLENNTDLDPSALLYLRYLRGDIGEFLQDRPNDKPARWNEADVVRNGKSTRPAPLALLNRAFDALRKPAKDIVGSNRSRLQDAKSWKEVDRMLAPFEGKSLANTEEGMQSTIRGQDKSANLGVRELVQNSRDHGRGKDIHVESFLREEARQWVRRVTDQGAGMDLATILGPLLVVEESNKTANGTESFAGKFGQGFYTLFADYDRVLIKTGNGKNTFYIELIKGENGLPVLGARVQTKEKFQGTVVEWIKAYDPANPPYLDALVLGQDLIRYTGAVQDTRIFYNGRQINEKPDIAETVPVDIPIPGEASPRRGQITIRLNPGNVQKRVTQDELFIMPLASWMFDLVPDKFKEYLLGRGVTVDMPTFLGVTRTRTAFIHEDNPEFRRGIQQAVFVACMKLSVQLYFHRNRLPPWLSDDFLSDKRVNELTLPNDLIDGTRQQFVDPDVITDARIMDALEPAEWGNIDFRKYHVTAADPLAEAQEKGRKVGELISILHTEIKGQQTSLWESRQEIYAARNDPERTRQFLEKMGDLKLSSRMSEGSHRIRERERMALTPVYRVPPAVIAKSPTLQRFVGYFERILETIGETGVKIRLSFHPLEETHQASAKGKSIDFRFTAGFELLKKFNALLSKADDHSIFAFFLETLGVLIHELAHHRELSGGKATHQALRLEQEEKAELPYFAGGDIPDLLNIGGFGWHQMMVQAAYLQAMKRGAWDAIVADLKARFAEGPSDFKQVTDWIVAQHAELPPRDGELGGYEDMPIPPVVNFELEEGDRPSDRDAGGDVEFLMERLGDKDVALMVSVDNRLQIQEFLAEMDRRGRPNKIYLFASDAASPVMRGWKRFVETQFARNAIWRDEPVLAGEADRAVVRLALLELALGRLHQDQRSNLIVALPVDAAIDAADVVAGQKLLLKDVEIRLINEIFLSVPISAPALILLDKAARLAAEAA